MGHLLRRGRRRARRPLHHPGRRCRRRSQRLLTRHHALTTQTQRPAAAGPRAGRRGFASFAAVTAASLAAAATLAAVDPHEPGHYPTCPFLSVSGLYCPGCGTLRALHDVLVGDLPGALARNPLTVVMAPLLVVAWVCWGLRLLGRDAPDPTRLPARWVWALLGVVLAYWVLRNVPGWTWLSPA